MWALIVAPETRIFGIALAVMLLLGILETVSLLSGGFTDWIDGLLPEGFGEAAHAEVGFDAAASGLWVRCLSWLYVGKLPLLMLTVVFLAVYGLAGYSIQAAFQALSGFYLNMWLAAAVAWFAALLPVRWTAAGLYRILPKDETTAVFSSDLVGRVGVVVLGTAAAGSPAQVRVRDAFGQQHYVMAEADGNDTLPQGSAVLLVSEQQGCFKAIANPSGSLVD